MNDENKASVKALKKNTINGIQKAALLTIALNVETAAELFKNLKPYQVEKISSEIAKAKNIPAEVLNNVLSEFDNMATAREYVLQGGIEYAQSVLEKSFGIGQAAEVIEKIKSLSTEKGFEILQKADSSQLVNFLSKEHTQTIALILSHLGVNQTAEVLKELQEPIRSDVVYRIATLGKISPETLQQIVSVVDEIAGVSVNQAAVSSLGGTRSIANILNKTSVSLSKEILEKLEQKDEEISGEIKRMMFLFEDIVRIQDKEVQKILRGIDRKDLALSLKVADEKLKEKIFANMSERAADLLKEELEMMGMVKLKDVETAQAKIIDVIKGLEEKGEVVLNMRGGTEEVYV